MNFFLTIWFAIKNGKNGLMMSLPFLRLLFFAKKTQAGSR